jgi:predicted nucleotidyltransferase
MPTVRRGGATGTTFAGFSCRPELPGWGLPVSRATRHPAGGPIPSVRSGWTVVAGVTPWHGRMSTMARMRPSQVLASRREDVLALARERGATNVRVFGSVARGEDSLSSDIDLLVDFPPGTTLLTVIGLELALRELVDVDVDLGPADALRPEMRERVLGEAQPL